MEHWAAHGFPRYVQFDNGTVFHGPPKPDALGQVVRMCLQLGIIPVFAAPRETGPQNPVEGYNAKWQRGVWQRFRFADCDGTQVQSRLYVDAHNRKNAAKIASAPSRTPLPPTFRPDFTRPLAGRVICIRRADDAGNVSILQRSVAVHPDQANRLVRCELDITAGTIECYELSRSAPDTSDLLCEREFTLPARPFKPRSAAPPPGA